MGFWNWVLLFVIGAVSSLVYILYRRYTYWDDWGIPVAGSFPLGILKGNGSKYHISEIISKHYNEMKKKALFGGLYLLINPIALILDLDLVKNIMVKDFNHFQNRGLFFNEKDDPLSAHLFAIEGQKWRNLRAKLTPTFTSGKMKMMYPTMIGVGEQFREYLKRAVSTSNEIEMKDVLARFMTDIIGTCAFGIDCNSLQDPDSEFRAMGKRIFEIPRYGAFVMLFIAQFRSLARTLRMKVIRDEVSAFFMNAVHQTIEYRQKNNVKRNDFMDLLIELKNQPGSDQLTENEIAAQAFVFFAAGFETSSTAMSYALYELSLNMEVQERARECVRSVLKKHNGVMSYEAVLEMTYIDQCINEALRKYPPATVLNRKTVKDYPVPGTKHVLKAGTSVMIPVYSIQHDPEYYPDPETYDPDRFSAEETAKRNPFTFLPFGEGPRVCIGLRFGMMQSRIGLAILLSDFKFTKCSKSIIPLKFSTFRFILSPAAGLWLNVEKIN